MLFSLLGAAPAPQPNFVMLLADDWGWGDAGSFAQLVTGGDKPPHTPELDRMSAEGTIFTRFHTLASVCSPSRASWLTGRYPLDVGSPYIYQCTHEGKCAISLLPTHESAAILATDLMLRLWCPWFAPSLQPTKGSVNGTLSR